MGLTPRMTPRTKNRRLLKCAHASVGQGAHGAQHRSVHRVHEDASTGATQPYTAGVAFQKTSAFTLLEVILAMAIMVLLAGAIYSISSAAIESTKETIVEQFTMRRLAGFLQITRTAFLNLPADGTVFLSNDSNNTIPDLNFENATGLFGIASLGGGILTLSAQPSSDGTRTFSMLRIPKNVEGSDLDHFYQNASWVKLLPKVQKPHWSFFRKGEWVDEWPRGSGRPQLVRLEMEIVGIKDPIESIFYVPAIAKVAFGVPGYVPPNTHQ